jgi:hypothetical protein
MSARSFVAAATLVVGCGGSATLTAQGSVTPILIGPVHRIGGGERLASSAAGSFGTWTEGEAMTPKNTFDWAVWQATKGERSRYISVDGAQCGGTVMLPVGFLPVFLPTESCGLGGKIRVVSPLVPPAVERK